MEKSSKEILQRNVGIGKGHRHFLLLRIWAGRDIICGYVLRVSLL